MPRDSAGPPGPDGAPLAFGLPRRDLILLPLISLFTVLLLFGIAEAVSRVVYPEQKQDSCMMYDARLGYRFRPNCVSMEKAAEGPWVQNRYNECGYRTDESCGPKPANAIRVAVVGSSIAQGYLVPYADTFATRAANLLTQSCHKPVEFQNLAGIGYIWDKVYDRLDEALALKPDAVVMATIPFDLQQTEDAPPIAAPAADAKAQPVDVAHPHGGFDFRYWLQLVLSNSRAVVAAQHIMFQNPELYLRLYLHYGDKADFLRPPFTPAWRQRR